MSPAQDRARGRKFKASAKEGTQFDRFFTLFSKFPPSPLRAGGVRGSTIGAERQRSLNLLSHKYFKAPTITVMILLSSINIEPHYPYLTGRVRARPIQGSAPLYLAARSRECLLGGDASSNGRSRALYRYRHTHTCWMGAWLHKLQFLSDHWCPVWLVQFIHYVVPRGSDGTRRGQTLLQRASELELTLPRPITSTRNIRGGMFYAALYVRPDPGYKICDGIKINCNRGMGCSRNCQLSISPRWGTASSRNRRYLVPELPGLAEQFLGSQTLRTKKH